MSHIIDNRQQLLTLSESGIAAIEKLAYGWLAEDEAACAPSGTPIDTPTTGGQVSDPTGRTATVTRGDEDDPTVGRVDVDKYRHRDRLGQRIVALVEALQAEAKALEPRHTRDLPQCANCGAAPAIAHMRCDFCGPFWRANRDSEGRRFDRDPDEARRYWSNKDETRPCVECGREVSRVSGRKRCEGCLKREQRRRKGEAA